jgi:serine/threonine-protein kinase
VDELVMRALAAEPEARFQDAAALGAELAKLKAKLAPRVGDADLARLMAEAFAEEKAVEDGLLAELLHGEGAHASSEKVPAAFVPPTALAFEHRALAAPEDYVPEEREAPASLAAAAPEGPVPPPPPPPRRMTREARVGFGVDMTQPLDAEALGAALVEAAEPSLVRAIEGGEAEDEDDRAGTAEYDTAGALRRLRWVGAALFLGAGALGFAVVWLLMR